MTTVKKALRYFLLFLGVLLLLLTAVIFSIRLPSVQNYITSQAIDFVSSKTNSKIELDRVYIGFFNSIIIEGLYAEDQNKDTLAYIGSLEASINVFSLVGKKINISSVELSNSTINLHTTKKSPDYNFQFIIDAFANNEPSAPEPPKDTTSESWAFGVDEVNISNINFTYNDVHNGVYAQTALQQLTINIDELVLETNTFEIDELLLANTTTIVRMMPSYAAKDTTTSEATPFKLTVNKLEINNNQFDFEDEVGNMHLDTKIGNLQVALNEFDLISQRIDLSSIKVNQSNINFTQGVIAKATETVPDKAEEESTDWNIKLANLQIDSTQFKYDDENVARIEKGMDFSHLGFDFKAIDIQEIRYIGIDDIALSIKQLALKEQSGFGLANTQLEFKMTDQSIDVNQLDLKTTDGTRLSNQVALSFESLNTLSEQIENLGFTVNISNSAISLKDITYFSPELADNEYVNNLIYQNLAVTADMKGKVNDINIKNIELNLFDQTHLQLKGTVKEAMKPELLYVDLTLNDISTTRNNIQQLLPKNTLPEGITIPNRITVNGNAKGGLNDLKSQLQLLTDLGNVNINSTIENGAKDLDSLRYLVDLTAKNIALGKLLNDTNFNQVSLLTKVQGKGVDPKKGAAAIESKISDFEYSKYKYAPYTLSVLYENEQLSWSSEMRDTNLLFDLNGAVKLAEEQSTYKLDLNLIGADFQLLNLIEDDTRLKLKLKTDLEGNTIDNIVGNLDLRGFQILRNDEIYTVDSLLFISFKDSSNSNIELNSDIISGFFRGNVQLSTIGTSMTNFFKGYYNDSLKTQLEEENQQFSFDLKIENNPLLNEVLLTDLERFETSFINGEFNAKKNYFTLNANFPKTEYSGIAIDSLNLNADANGEQLNFKLNINQINQGDYVMSNISLQGETNEDTLLTRFIQHEQGKAINYFLEAVSFKKDENVRVEFRSDSTIINRNNWTIARESFMEFGNQLKIDLAMNHDKEALTIQNREDDINQLALTFNQFKIQNLVNFVKSAEADSIRIIAGKLNGKSTVNLEENNFGFIADLSLDDLKVFEESIGNMNLKANKKQAVYELSALLSGNENEVSINGMYNENGALDLTANVSQLNIKTIAAFSQDQVRKPTGNVSGNFNLTGTTEDPIIDGFLSFNQVQFRSTYLNSRYTLKNERIEIANEKIHFKQFTVLDSIGNNFKINGGVQFDDIDNLAFDLTIKSKNFQALNTTKEGNNDLFYGKVLFSSDVTVKGNQNKPVVNAKLKLNKGTDFTFVLPESDPSEVSQEGVIVFVDKDQKLSDLFSRDKNVDTVKADITGIDVTAQIEIDDNTNLNIIVDPIAGDKLTLKGGGTLNSQIDPSGNISLTGRYVINDGMYNLTLYDFVKRDFLIEKGSSITWTGDPLKANMDISAIYEVKAAPIDLLSNQSGSLSESERLTYQEKLPFLVSLNMNDELMSPDISFDIDLEEDKKGALNGLVYAKLQELNQSESELNKQVFTLIILNRFVSTGNFTNQSDGANAARSSVSKIMNQQLNRLSDKYIKGVNLEFDMDSYEGYNAEQGGFEGRTELNLAVSKSFLNDRIAVKVGGDLDLEGERAKQNTISDFAGDVSIEYMITEDGRYKAKLFRDNRFEGVLEGDIIETGISLIYNRDYDTAKKLFRKPEEIKEQNDEE